MLSKREHSLAALANLWQLYVIPLPACAMCALDSSLLVALSFASGASVCRPAIPMYVLGYPTSCAPQPQRA